MHVRECAAKGDTLPPGAAQDAERWHARWGECHVFIYTPKVAQKSYGTERRFLCPPPMISLVGHAFSTRNPLASPAGIPVAHHPGVPAWLRHPHLNEVPEIEMLMQGDAESE
ncbi:hypothetical protein AMAG_09181, partial [Allomyces macrogynus ATCC 38327]